LLVTIDFDVAYDLELMAVNFLASWVLGWTFFRKAFLYWGEGIKDWYGDIRVLG